MVEDTTEVPDFVIAIPKVYRDIEVAFSETDNLALEFCHHKAQIVTAFGCSQSLVSVFVQQDHWREYVHNGVLRLLPMRADQFCSPLLRHLRIARANI
jgi:hypothetical protein